MITEAYSFQPSPVLTPFFIYCPFDNPSKMDAGRMDASIEVAILWLRANARPPVACGQRVFGEKCIVVFMVR